jgi:molybdate transport system substrate-binding protein
VTRGHGEIEMSPARNLERLLLTAVAICWLAPLGFAQRKQIRVAAAADLQTAMPELAKLFEAQTGVSVDVVYGSSGNFFSQIQNGAPLDVFFSADSEYPRKLGKSGFAEPHTAVVYAIGSIVLWMPANAACNPEAEQWKCLQQSSVKKIAIANPEHAPYGRAAVEALQKAGIYDEVKAKLVFGENISQAAQFVQSGNAQAGILAYSLTRSPALSGGKLWEIPRESYLPIEQTVIILKAAKEKPAAQEFVKFVTQGSGRTALAKFGFQPPAR